MSASAEGPADDRRTLVFRHLAALKTIAAFTAGRVRPAALAAPWLIAAALALLILGNYIVADKGILERQALEILAVAVGVASLRYWFLRRPYFLWLTALCASLLMREIHFAGTSFAIFVALGALLAIAWLRYPLFREYFASSTVISLLSSILVAYFIAHTLDQRWWKFVPGEATFEVPLEELMETVGHAAVLLLALVSRAESEPPALPGLVA